MHTQIETLIFDLDNTLYSPDSGLLATVGKRISEYITLRLGLKTNDADLLREKYRNRYGITLPGLIDFHNIDPIDFDTYVYDIDYDEKIKSDPKLKILLNSMPQKKIVYTNAGSRHASIVLNNLGLSECFDKVIAIEDLDFLAKPTKESFDYFIKLTQVDPKTSIFFEDSIDNLNTAKTFGFTTALVGVPEHSADYNLADIHSLPHIPLI